MVVEDGNPADLWRATAMPTGMVARGSSTEDTESGEVTVSLFSLFFTMADESLLALEAGLVNNESLEL